MNFSFEKILRRLGIKPFGKLANSENMNLADPQVARNTNAVPAYLADNDWEKELNYKTWVTKGARFQANKRLLETHRLSTRALSYLSCYLIIATLLPVFVGDDSLPFPAYWLNFLITSISILLLVFTQIESSADYKLRGHQLHVNALKIAEVYNEIRIAKHIENNKDRLTKIIELTRRYESILVECENHDPIDYEVSKTQKPDYFNLTPAKVKSIYKRYNRSVRSKYIWLIWIPGIFTAILSAIVLIGPVFQKKPFKEEIQTVSPGVQPDFNQKFTEPDFSKDASQQKQQPLL